jgi:hypothetical protein
MDRDKAREALPLIADDAVRESETMRIEGNYNLEMALSELYTARKGKMPEKEVLLRITDAVQILLYDPAANPEPEQKARRDYANQVLDAEFR